MKTKIKILETELTNKRDEINNLYSRNLSLYRENNELNQKYLILLTKYNQLINNLTSKDTEIIMYKGEMYSIESLSFYERTGEIKELKLSAIHVSKEKGLIDTLNDTYKNVAKEFNKILYGNSKGE